MKRFNGRSKVFLFFVQLSNSHFFVIISMFSQSKLATRWRRCWRLGRGWRCKNIYIDLQVNWNYVNRKECDPFHGTRKWCCWWNGEQSLSLYYLSSAKIFHSLFILFSFNLGHLLLSFLLLFSLHSIILSSSFSDL